MNFLELARNKNGPGASCLARRGLYNVDCLCADSKSD